MTEYKPYTLNELFEGKNDDPCIEVKLDFNLGEWRYIQPNEKAPFEQFRRGLWSDLSFRFEKKQLWLFVPTELAKKIDSLSPMEKRIMRVRGFYDHPDPPEYYLIVDFVEPYHSPPGALSLIQSAGGELSFAEDGQLSLVENH